MTTDDIDAFGGVSNRLQPRVFGDLRGWIDAIREEDALQDIDVEVDWNCELGTIARKAFGTGQGPAILFKNISGYNGEDSRCSQLFTGGMSNYSRLAMTLGLPKDSPARDLVLATRYYLSQRIEPIEVTTGPVKENIIEAGDINLFDFPVPKWHREDGGRYINTFQATVTMDPDTGVHNLGIYRGMIGQKIHFQSFFGELRTGGPFSKVGGPRAKMPVAHVYGWEPSLPYCASAPVPTGISEYDIMGAIRGAPVELVKCETNDLMVPASAELVVEGYIDSDPSTFEMEGPFGEYPGYFGGDAGPKHVTKVTCITHRNNPIFRGTLEGTLPKMLNENSVMSSIQRAGVAWNVLERAGVPGVTDVHCSPANNGTTVFIQLKQTYRGQAKQAAAALWGSNSAHLRYKNVWVLDDDIDIRDYGAVDWAFAYRVNASEDDIVFFPANFGSLLDPSTRLKDRDPMLYGTGKWCRVLIDATINLDFEPEEQYGGNRYPPTVAPHKADMDKVNARWKEYGFED